MLAFPVRHFAILLCLTLGSVTTSCKRAQGKSKGPGDRLHSFIVKNCEDGKRYCQVCAFSGKPTIMAVADIDDPTFVEDLKRIQSLTEQYEGLTAFAIFGHINGKALEPVGDEAQATEKLKAFKKELGIKFPITLLPSGQTPEEAKNYPKFSDAYEVSASRTLFFAGPGNKIAFAGVMEAKTRATQYQALEAVLKQTL